MKKKIIIALVILIIGILGFIYYYNATSIDGEYTIKVKEIDDKSPDRELIVLRNNRVTKKYKYIKYVDDPDVILCKVENPTINKHEIIDIDELVVVFPNNEEKIAKIIND